MVGFIDDFVNKFVKFLLINVGVFGIVWMMFLVVGKSCLRWVMEMLVVIEIMIFCEKLIFINLV